MTAMSKNLGVGEFLCTRCNQSYCWRNSKGNAYLCAACKATFPMPDGIIDFIPEWDEPASMTQRAIEWAPLVSLYESRLWRRNPLFEWLTQLSMEEEADAVLSAASLKGNEKVLDLACGTGNYSRLFAGHLPQGRVYGVDFSKAMLNYAHGKTQRLGVKGVQFIRANVLELPFADESIDVVNCCGALHLFPELDTALAEIQRVLKPGGRFTTAVFRQEKGALSRWFEFLSEHFLGISSFSLQGLTGQLHNVGLNHNEAFHDKGHWLVLRSEK